MARRGDRQEWFWAAVLAVALAVMALLTVAPWFGWGR